MTHLEGAEQASERRAAATNACEGTATVLALVAGDREKLTGTRRAGEYGKAFVVHVDMGGWVGYIKGQKENKGAGPERTWKRPH